MKCEKIYLQLSIYPYGERYANILPHSTFIFSLLQKFGVGVGWSVIYHPELVAVFPKFPSATQVAKTDLAAELDLGESNSHQQR